MNKATFFFVCQKFSVFLHIMKLENIIQDKQIIWLIKAILAIALLLLLILLIQKSLDLHLYIIRYRQVSQLIMP